MGMAASQARFLNLTARKSNIEYEGQQINQQRTSLSNQSADLYNQMLTLQVPTPPSTQDYTKVSYTFSIPGVADSEGTISQITKDQNGTYTVTFSYSQTELGFPPCSTNNYSTVNAINDTSHTGNVTTSKGKSYNLNYIDPNNIPKEHQDAYDSLKTNTGGTDYNIYWINVGTDESPSYQYYRGSELVEAYNGDTKRCVNYSAGDVTTYKTDSYQGCTINRDKYNRVQSFTYKDQEFAVNTNSVVDEEAYDDAMNEYTYKSYLYEQEMNNINAQTSVIQAQDKDLELRLKQLDTEHNAVQTEIESVSSVVKKNVEDSFKTFA